MSVDLNGKRIIVVEDDFILATDICRELQSRGATVLGPAPTPYYALQLMGPKDRRRIDAAVLDIYLHGTTVFEVADALHERGVPYVFATAYSNAAIPSRYTGVPVLHKPISPTVLASAVGRLVRKPRPTPAPVELPARNVTEPPAIVFARAIGSMLGKHPAPNEATEPPVTVEMDLGQETHLQTVG